MTIRALKRKKQELLASQVSRIASDTNENLLRVNLSKFFTDLEHDIQSVLLEYWNDHMLLQGQVNLILASIHEKHQEYYELIMKHKLQEFHRAEKLGERLVKRQEQSAMKATKPVKITATPNNLFGTLKYSEDKLANDTFKASQNTLNRVDSNINDILLDGYKSGVGINEVSRQITERFDQLRTWEAKRIARTEIHTAQNMGVMNSYDQLGVEYTQWISAGDARTRESHVEINEEIIPFGGTYSNGLRFPGDTSGPIEEWINCRCSNAPFVMPAGMMAPSFSPFKESDLIPIEPEPVQPTEPQPVKELLTQIETEPLKPRSLKQHLRKELPSEFSDEAITYIQKTINKRGKKAKTEYGQIFDYKTGKTTSPEFKGGKYQVAMPDRGYIKPLDKMGLDELRDLRKNPEKYIVSYVDGSNSLASQHNHPPRGMPCFSDTDIYKYVSTPWEDYGLAISEHETWVCECKGVMDTHTASKIRDDVGRIIEDSKKQSREEFERRYGYSIPKTLEESKINIELGREIYAKNFLEYFDKNKHYGIKITRVVY